VKKLLSILFNHERYQTISVICVLVFLIFMFSCSPKCHSILEPSKRITKIELDGEITLLQARIDNELRSLEQQEAIQTLFLSLAQSYVATGVINPASAVTGALALLSTGAVIDNARKRREIKKLCSCADKSV